MKDPDPENLSILRSKYFPIAIIIAGVGMALIVLGWRAASQEAGRRRQLPQDPVWKAASDRRNDVGNGPNRVKRENEFDPKTQETPPEPAGPSSLRERPSSLVPAEREAAPTRTELLPPSFCEPRMSRSRRFFPLATSKDAPGRDPYVDPSPSCWETDARP